MDKAQVAVEISFIFGIGFLLLMMFIGLTYSHIEDLNSRKKQELIEDITFKLQKEIVLASNSKDGYYRNFTMPMKVGNDDYNATIYGNTLKVTIEDNQFWLKVPNVHGNATKGYNIIRKQDGEVYIE
jgi:hypothetical protein